MQIILSYLIDRKPPAGHERDTYSLSITVNGEKLGGGHRHTNCWGTCKLFVSLI